LAQPIEPKREDWLRGVDLNHRPWGYERVLLLAYELLPSTPVIPQVHCYFEAPSDIPVICLAHLYGLLSE
jgi:hypothetical protein